MKLKVGDKVRLKEGSIIYKNIKPGQIVEVTEIISDNSFKFNRLVNCCANNQFWDLVDDNEIIKVNPIIYEKINDWGF